MKSKRSTRHGVMKISSNELVALSLPRYKIFSCMNICLLFLALRDWNHIVAIKPTCILVFHTCFKQLHFASGTH